MADSANRKNSSNIETFIYLATMSQRCPFDKKSADDLEFVGMLIAYGDTRSSQVEAEAALKTARARAQRELDTSKDSSCAKAEESVTEFGSQIIASTVPDANEQRGTQSPTVQKLTGYANVAAALKALDSSLEVQVQPLPSGKVIAHETGGIEWEFVAPQHYAYPSVVRHEFIPNGRGGRCEETRMLCDAQSSACQRFATELRDAGRWRSACEGG
jgi:hypothetical protein